jgi:hypothetical protein
VFNFFPRDTWAASKPLGKFIKIDMGAEGEVNGASEEENGTLRRLLVTAEIVVIKK